MEQEIPKLDLSELEAMFFPKISNINLSNLTVNLTDLIWGEGGGKMPWKKIIVIVEQIL